MDLKVKCRFWVESEKGPFLGFGRIELLEKIDELGSINRAAKAMNMAYRQAWRLVESMNSKAEKPLVEKQTGGKGGGGTYITPEGKKAIQMFKELEKEFQEFMDHTSARLVL